MERAATASASGTQLCCVVAPCPQRAVTTAAGAVRRAALAGVEPLGRLGSPSIVWIPREDGEDGWSFVGWGAVARARGEGEARFDEVRDRAELLWERIDGAGALPIAPRLFGGFAFDADSHHRRETDVAGAWAPFGDASFFLPRLLYGCSGDRAFVAAFGVEPTVAGALASAARRALDSIQPVFASSSLSSPSPLPSPSPSPSPTFDDGDERSWAALVTAALAEIDRRALRKVVLCRTRRVAFSREPDLLRAVALLEARHRSCARFLFEQGGATFLGATPERLLSVRGRRAVTEALAGTLPRIGGDEDARRRLLASDKDRAEHAFVVDAIRAALAPSCDALSIPGAPLVRTLPHVHHLATPIAGLLAGRAHVLDLAARLHPTPALCGTPRAEARAFLLAREPEPRGWYGGGAGWIDASGDGEIAVAIRSAIAVRRTAWIYAGAGIVSGSDPVSEYEETTIKERAMREALEAAA